MRFLITAALLVAAASYGFAGTAWNVVPIEGDPVVFDMGIEGATVWMSTNGRGLVGYDGTNWVFHTTDNSGIRSNNWNYTVMVDAAGDKWVGRDGTNTVDRLDDAGTVFDQADDSWSYYTHQIELVNQRVFSMAEDSGGNKWFGMRDENHNREGTVEYLIENDPTTTEDDVWYHYDNAWTPDSTSFSDDDVRALAVDAGDRLWIGYYATGLDVWDYKDPSVYADDTWTHYSTADGLPSDLVHVIRVGPDGRMWVGTLGGLAVFDPAKGEWTTVAGLPGVQARAVDFDGQGHVWVGTENGVAMLYANGSVAFTYGVADGIADDQINELAVDRSSGRVWAISIDESTQATSLNVFDSGFGGQAGRFYVYPNPWTEDRADGLVTVFGAPEGSTIEIFDLTGQKVRELPRTEPYVWDTLNFDLREVPSGVYIVRVETPRGEVALLKAAIVR